MSRNVLINIYIKKFVFVTHVPRYLSITANFECFYIWVVKRVKTPLKFWQKRVVSAVKDFILMVVHLNSVVSVVRFYFNSGEVKQGSELRQ